MRRQTDTLRSALGEIQQQQLQRRRRVVAATPGGNREAGVSAVAVDGRTLLNFCSNDYLGLARHPLLAEAMRTAANDYGSGAGAAHLVCGHTQEHHALEEELAAHVGRERALLFSTGYMANIGVISSLIGRGETMLQDRLNHASLLDGGRLSGARLLRYAHADAAAAAERCSALASISMLATDAVFSMDGDLAPLSELAALCRAQQSWLLVDDAHGLGCSGRQGSGSVAAAGLTQDDVPLLVGTLGKALGSAGAFVAGSHDLIEFILQRARSYIYTTAMPAPVAAATRAALRLCRHEEWRRERLRRHVTRFRTGARSLGIQLKHSDSAIQPLVIGDSGRALQLAAALEDAGYWVSAIRPPTVPPGTARLRITLSAAHQDAEIDGLLSALAATRQLWAFD